MEWINDIKEKFSKRRIRNLDRAKEYPRDFVDIESARLIGMIINVNILTEEDEKSLKSYMEALIKRKKKLFIVELNFNKKSEPKFDKMADSVFIDPSKLNWMDWPTPAIENKILGFDMDILMDFDFSTRKTSKYLCSMAKARTRTGVHREGYESCYELMVNQSDESDEPSMKAVIKKFDYFLSMIDNGKKEKVKVK
ncbi:DUF6913 domain-containing protein [Pontibacter sp. G13]|uniref:DUF6913 domain-containing protein n=1 Tax=Pontibacter sp. G13 TaxID=3074898 RepID=UPI0028896043|nr:hypothetical protein [Pontibacter sp. G13]WNJ18609.1 hypothetical protein RJD25_27450 [Pontibacter sp. G13]